MKNICTKAEWVMMERGLKAAERRLEYARQTATGTAIYQSIPSIEGHINYIRDFLNTHEASKT